MPNIAAPRKSFQFRVNIPGIGNFEVQKVTLPEIEIEMVAHGDTNYDVKTPGRVKTTELVLEKLVPTVPLGPDALVRLNNAQNPVTGGGLLPSALNQVITVESLDSTGLAVLQTHTYDGCWLQKLSQNDLDRLSSDNQIETLTWSVNRRIA